jgi:hypothetical protein
VITPGNVKYLELTWRLSTNWTMSRSIAALLLVFLCFSWLSAGPESAIYGQITDSEGAVIANARVLVHWDSSGSTVGLRDNIGIRHDVTVVTDNTGRYSADVPAGFYDVFVSAMAFTPTATKVRVKEGRPATFNTSLKADPLVSKELGDEISPSK